MDQQYGPHDQEDEPEDRLPPLPGRYVRDVLDQDDDEEARAEIPEQYFDRNVGDEHERINILVAPLPICYASQLEQVTCEQDDGCERERPEPGLEEYRGQDDPDQAKDGECLVDRLLDLWLGSPTLPQTSIGRINFRIQDV